MAAGLAALMIGGRLRHRVRRYEIAESSMSPALLPGDYVLAVLARQAPMRGDIVILPHPTRTNFELAKRVVGLPGELVTIADGRVHIDGAVVPEPWTAEPTLPASEWRVGDGEVFVLGDHRSVSIGDSRTLGAVALERPVWLAAWRYWPPRRFGWL